jgi:hypothetical protein
VPAAVVPAALTERTPVPAGPRINRQLWPPRPVAAPAGRPEGPASDGRSPDGRSGAERRRRPSEDWT